MDFLHAGLIHGREVKGSRFSSRLLEHRPVQTCPTEVLRYIWLEKRLPRFGALGALLGFVVAIVGYVNGWLSSTEFLFGVVLGPVLVYQAMVEVVLAIANGWTKWLILGTSLLIVWIFGGAVAAEKITSGEALVTALLVGPVLTTVLVAWLIKLNGRILGLLTDTEFPILLAAPHSLETGDSSKTLLSEVLWGGSRLILWETCKISTHKESLEYLEQACEYTKDSAGTPAFNWARAVQVVRWSYTAGLISFKESSEFLSRIGHLTSNEYSGWDDFGRAFLDGESHRCRKLGVQPSMGPQVSKLLSEPHSQWNKFPWPRSNGMTGEMKDDRPTGPPAISEA